MAPSFFDLLWPEKPDAFLSTWLKKSNGIQIFHTSKLKEAEAYMADASKWDDVYFCVALLGAPPSRGRGTAADVAFVPGPHMDFDIAPLDANVHAKSNLPHSLEELNKFLVEAGIPRPTAMVNSGNGVHGYWRLSEPLDTRSDDARKCAGELMRNFQKSIIALAKAKRGWNFDNTSDLARVLRYPGTLNHKTNPAKRVELINVAY